MKYLLYLSAAESQLWGQDGSGWRQVTGEPQGPVWVVTDLAEESFAEIKTPKLFGSDRSTYIARQLATRYPDTPYRAFMTPAQDGDLISMIAPTRYILFGVEAAERLDTELDAVPVPVVGVWPISMLLAQSGLDESLPDSLFVVLPGSGTLRIVYLKNGTPVLTRLTQTPNEVDAQLDEITRTLRHLENTQTVPRDRRTLSVLLLGDSTGYEEAMAAVKLELVRLPKWRKQPPDDWRFPLFDQCVKSPKGQVAPLIRRTDYLSQRLSKWAVILALSILVVSVAAAGKNLWSMFDILDQSRAMEDSIQQLNARIAGVQQNINQFGADPETVRRAVALDEEEVRSVPSMEEHLRLVADVLESDPNLRVTDLQWRLLTAAVLPCALTIVADQAEAGGEAAPASDQRKVELSFQLALPSTYGPRDRALALRTISKELVRIEGLTLWQDATKDLFSGSLQGGSLFEASARPSWCMTLPAPLLVSDASKRDHSS
ncbi:MAG: hypothetical protein K9J74_05020 [Sulfuritalea sp.]|nr:hypothetical protein [Sulfuritalea sp.]